MGSERNARRRCSAITLAGEQCKLSARSDDDRCARHASQPAHISGRRSAEPATSARRVPLPPGRSSTRKGTNPSYRFALAVAIAALALAGTLSAVEVGRDSRAVELLATTPPFATLAEPSSTTTSSTTPTSTTTTTPPSTTTSTTLFKGQQASDAMPDSHEVVTVFPYRLRARPTNLFTRDEYSTMYMCASVVIQNASTVVLPYNGLDWRLQLPSGEIHRSSIALIDDEIVVGQIAPGGEVSGGVCFESPGIRGPFVLLFQPSYAAGKRGAWIFSCPAAAVARNQYTETAAETLRFLEGRVRC